MSLYGQEVSQWLNGGMSMNLEAPNDYKAHGRNGRQPYRHVVRHEARHTNIRKVEGSSNEQSVNYSMLMLDISDIKAYYDVMFPSFKKNYMIQPEESEACYDWLISEAIKKIVTATGSYLKNHFRNDVYKCAYDEIGNLVEKNLREKFEQQGYGFMLGTKVKTLICGPTIMLARTTNG